jgi:hypothetical protein
VGVAEGVGLSVALGVALGVAEAVGVDDASEVDEGVGEIELVADFVAVAVPASGLGTTIFTQKDWSPAGPIPK